MDENEFWALIDTAHEQSGGDMAKKSKAIKLAIAELNESNAIAFARHFDAKMDAAYNWPLWGAAYLINGGCGDDSFADFRAALISRGRVSFEKAMRDPDALADEDIDTEQWFYESFSYAVIEGVEAAADDVPPRQQAHPSEPNGTEWSDEELPSLLPRLSAKFS